MRKTIKKISVAFYSMIVMLCMASCSERIDAGHEGIKVNLYGSEKGVDDMSLVTGVVWYNPFTEDVFEALDIQDKLQTLYTSGTVFHSFLGQRVSDWKACANLVRKIAENFKLPYYTMSPTYSVCKDHGYIAGEHYVCPKCKQPAKVFKEVK